MGGSGRAWRLVAAACVVAHLLVGHERGTDGRRPQPRRDDSHRIDGCLERLSVSRHPARRYRTDSVAGRGPGRGAQVRRRDRAEHHGERGDVEQPPHGHHGRGRAQRQAVVRVGLLDERRRGVRGRRERGRDVHRLHQPERRLPEREGAVVQGVGSGARDRTRTRSWRSSSRGRRTGERSRGDISSSAPHLVSASPAWPSPCR